MANPILIVLGVLAGFTILMLAMAGFRQTIRRFLAAVLAFVLTFVVVFGGTCWAMGGAPPVEQIPSTLQTADFWTANWIPIGLGLLLAIFSAKALLNRKV